VSEQTNVVDAEVRSGLKEFRSSKVQVSTRDRLDFT